MFYESIYTRCRKGIDLLKKGAKITSDGYKVYSCSAELLQEGTVDLPFFANAVQSKQSYVDPGFMDEAYLYYVPDTGSPFLTNFHPVTFNKEAKGDYSNRPGNFVNQTLVGEFRDLYTYELFGDSQVWNAKGRGEAYYYETETPELPPRSIAASRTLSVREIGAFIAAGRQETLARAVAFLVEQYALPPEERKFLVIKDEDSAKIELWIAAIQCAFSPKIAAGISFATRMDKFVNTNRYTVNLQGVYQTQINLQDPNQKQRWRAMVVGVDERDRNNVGAARSSANSPFAVLGDINADISRGGYFLAMAQFDDEHMRFCREFLQAFEFRAPNEQIADLYDIFNALNNLTSMEVSEIADALNSMSRFNMSGTEYFNAVYVQVYENVSLYLQKDTVSALDIINWLMKYNPQKEAQLMKKVCNSFIDCLYNNTKKAKAFWEGIIGKSYSTPVAFAVTDRIVLNENLDRIANPDDANVFFGIYHECYNSTKPKEREMFSYVLYVCLYVCYSHKDNMAFKRIVAPMASNLRENLSDVADIAKKNNDLDFAKYIIQNFNEGQFENLKTLEAYEKALATISLDTTVQVSDEFRVKIFREIEAKFDPLDESVPTLVKKVITMCDDKDLCPKIAHGFILLFLKEWQTKTPNERNDFFALLDEFRLPKNTSSEYTAVLAKRLYDVGAGLEEFKGLLRCIMRHEVHLRAFIAELVRASLKQGNTKWGMTLHFAAETQNTHIRNIIKEILVDAKVSEKNLAVLRDSIHGDDLKAYFEGIEKDVTEALNERKSANPVGKILGMFKKDKK
jgi:hypothetical protein